MIARGLAVLLFLTAGAAAHEAPVPHTHPHADWSLAIAIVLALAAFAALIALPLRATRHIGVKKNDPR